MSRELEQMYTMASRQKVLTIKIIATPTDMKMSYKDKSQKGKKKPIQHFKQVYDFVLRSFHNYLRLYVTPSGLWDSPWTQLIEGEGAWLVVSYQVKEISFLDIHPLEISEEVTGGFS